MIEYVDAHVYPLVPSFLEGPLAPYRSGLEQSLGRELVATDMHELAERFRATRGRAVLLGWDNESVTGQRPFGNSEVAETVAIAPDVFTGFGAADPMKGAAAVIQVHEAASLGLAGLSFSPSAQGIGPGDRYAAPVWEAAASQDLICLFNTGFPDMGAGTPGGSGVGLEKANPIHVDAIAAEYPAMDCVIAHRGRMWLEEALAVAEHKTNVWLDLSRLDHPLPDFLLDAVQGPLRERCVSGSNHPFGVLDVWREQWSQAAEPELGAAIFRGNPMRLLDGSH